MNLLNLIDLLIDLIIYIVNVHIYIFKKKKFYFCLLINIILRHSYGLKKNSNYINENRNESS